MSNEDAIILITESPVDNIKKETKRRESIEADDELQVIVNHPLYHKGAVFMESLHSYNVVLILTAIEAVFILGDIFISVYQSAHCASGLYVSHDGKNNICNSRSKSINYYRKMSFLGIIFSINNIRIRTYYKIDSVRVQIFAEKFLDAN
jgi:hypothetical protein